MSLRETINGTTIADRILFICLIAVSLVGLVFIKEVLPRSGDVTIEIQGKHAYRYPLDEDRSVDVASPTGRLTVQIKDRKVRVLHATCENKLCEQQGWVSSGVIICLPARISVIVGSPTGPKDREVDAISG